MCTKLPYVQVQAVYRDKPYRHFIQSFQTDHGRFATTKMWPRRAHQLFTTCVVNRIIVTVMVTRDAICSFCTASGFTAGIAENREESDSRVPDCSKRTVLYTAIYSRSRQRRTQ